MNISIFLMLLFAFSVVSGLFTECAKKIINDKANLSYNIIATSVYYQLNDIPFNADNIIYMILLGLASGLCSMLGYDKVKQSIIQITNKQDK